MAIRDQTALQVVLYEGEGAQELSAPERFALMAALLEKGYTIRRRSSEDGQGADAPNALMLGRFTNGYPGRKHGIEEFDVSRICEAVESARAEAQALRHGEWKPWFP